MIQLPLPSTIGAQPPHGTILTTKTTVRKNQENVYMYIQSYTYMSYQGIYVGTGSMNGSPIKFQPAKMDISMWGMLYCQKCTKCIRLQLSHVQFLFSASLQLHPLQKGGAESWHSHGLQWSDLLVCNGCLTKISNSPKEVKITIALCCQQLESCGNPKCPSIFEKKITPRSVHGPSTVAYLAQSVP